MKSVLNIILTEEGDLFVEEITNNNISFYTLDGKAIALWNIKYSREKSFPLKRAADPGVDRFFFEETLKKVYDYCKTAYPERLG